MSKIESLKDTITDYAGNLGLYATTSAMTVATVVGMLELPDHNAAGANRFILPSQVVRVEANDDLNELNNPIRRETEESTPQYKSYSQTQRTPSRSKTL